MRIETYQDGVLIESRDDRSLADAQAEAMQRISDSHNGALAAGVTVGGIRLDASDSATQTMVGGVTMLQLAVAAGIPMTADAPAVVDVDGLPHAMTVGQFFALAGGFGQQVAAVRAQRITLEQQIRAATTNDQADAVVWP